jgi:hypothetical protein
MPPPQPQRPLTDRGETDPKGNLTDRASWISGLLIQFAYTNSHHDPMPVCTVLYADRRYTHAINVSYLNGNQRQQFKQQLRMWYFLDPRMKYYYLKSYNPSCLIAYRTYFTYMLHPISAWEIKELEGSIPGAYALMSKVNGPAPTDFAKFGARAIGAATAHGQAMRNRPTQRPNQQRPDLRPRVRPLLERVTQRVNQIRASQRPGAIRPSQRPQKP